MTETNTIGQAIGEALSAYDELATLAEDVEDEWTYIQDLVAAWKDRLEAVVARRGEEAVGASEEAAIERAVDEIGRISDPHRAIDWLSTFPQVVLAAFGEQT